jgi:hypothetical protein
LDRYGHFPVQDINVRPRNTVYMQPTSGHNACNNRQWGPPASHDEAARRASGRTRYNRRRQVKAMLRRAKLLRICHELSCEGNWSPFRRGEQTRLAAMLGVSRSTICRDMQAIWGGGRAMTHSCPTCDSPLSFRRIEELARQNRLKVTHLWD